MDENLIDRIYEAAVVPELWPDVLDRIAALSGSAGTVLFTTDHKRVTRWTSSEAIIPVLEGFIAGGWSERNPRDTPRTREVGLARFGGDLDFFTPAELDREPMYADLLRPLGFGWFAGTHIAVPSGDVAVFDVERRIESGPMPRAELERLDRLRPHLARAAVLSTRLGLERAKAAVAALAALGLPAAILGAGARVVAANSLLVEPGSHALIGAFDRLAFGQPSAQEAFSEALRRMESGAAQAGASLPVRATPAAPAAVAHLVPVRGAAHDVFSNGLALLVLTPLATGAPPSVDLLGGLFDLTPAESRVARAIADGQTLDAHAASLGVSRETVRSQLKAVLAKTGTSRQGDLIRLLGQPVRPHPAPAGPSADAVPGDPGRPG